MRYSLKKSVAVAAAIACALASGAHAALTVSNAQTKNVTCTSGVCTPTGGNANLNVSDLVALLASSDVTVKSTVAAPDIGILDPLTWASSHRLVLDAYESIHVRAPVVVEGTSGLILITNDGGSGGDYNFNPATSGAITFWDTASSLVINGQIFILIDYNEDAPKGFPGRPPHRTALAKNVDASHWGTLAYSKFGKFVGTFEGLGNTISNLHISAEGYNDLLNIGLFGVLPAGGVVRDVNLTGASITGVQHNVQWRRPHPSYMGVLAGLVKGGSIIGCTASGSVSGNGIWMVGGLVGQNSGGSISLSSFSGSVTTDQGGTAQGGLVGFNSGTISQSEATSDMIAGYAIVGGLVGENLGAIEQSGASINYQTQTPSTQVGGFVGKNGSSGTIADSRATGTTYNGAGFAVSNEGGAITRSFASGVAVIGDGFVNVNSGTITNSYSTTASTLGDWGSGDIGGFAGENSGTIQSAYAAGPVSHQSGSGCSAGFVFIDLNGNNAHNYWDKTTTGQIYGGCRVNYAGITGLTDAQLKSALPAGFDPNVWGQSASINNGWPYLLANPPQ